MIDVHPPSAAMAVRRIQSVSTLADVVSDYDSVNVPVKFLKMLAAPCVDYVSSGVSCLLLLFQPRHPALHLTLLEAGNQAQMQTGKLHSVT